MMRSVVGVAMGGRGLLRGFGRDGRAAGSGLRGDARGRLGRAGVADSLAAGRERGASAREKNEVRIGAPSGSQEPNSRRPSWRQRRGKAPSLVEACPANSTVRRAGRGSRDPPRPAEMNRGPHPPRGRAPPVRGQGAARRQRLARPLPAAVAAGPPPGPRCDAGLHHSQGSRGPREPAVPAVRASHHVPVESQSRSLRPPAPVERHGRRPELLASGQRCASGSEYGAIAGLTVVHIAAVHPSHSAAPPQVPPPAPGPSAGVPRAAALAVGKRRRAAARAGVSARAVRIGIHARRATADPPRPRPARRCSPHVAVPGQPHVSVRRSTIRTPGAARTGTSSSRPRSRTAVSRGLAHGRCRHTVRGTPAAHRRRRRSTVAPGDAVRAAVATRPGAPARKRHGLRSHSPRAQFRSSSVTGCRSLVAAGGAQGRTPGHGPPQAGPGERAARTGGGTTQPPARSAAARAPRRSSRQLDGRPTSPRTPPLRSRRCRHPSGGTFPRGRAGVRRSSRRSTRGSPRRSRTPPRRRAAPARAGPCSRRSAGQARRSRRIAGADCRRRADVRRRSRRTGSSRRRRQVSSAPANRRGPSRRRRARPVAPQPADLPGQLTLALPRSHAPAVAAHSALWLQSIRGT